MTNATPNPTAEQAIAEALQDMWPDSTLFGDPWSPESHEVVSIASKLRTHGLLSEGAPSECLCYGADGVTDEKCPACKRADAGAPSEEQIEQGARALHEARNPWIVAHGSWAAAGYEIKQAFRESACVVAAARVARQGATGVGDTAVLPTETPESGSVGLDPEKVAEWLDEFLGRYALGDCPGSAELAVPFCEAHTEGKLT